MTKDRTTVEMLAEIKDLCQRLEKTEETLAVNLRSEKQAEEKILRLNRLYAVVSAIGHAIIHLNDRDAIFHEFCRVAVELGGYRLAWVGLVEREIGLVQMVAANGELGYLDGVRITINEEPEGLGPTGISIRQGTYYICNDFHKSEITRPWHKKAHAHGLYASASIVIKQNGEPVGALTLYAGEKDYFDERQVVLLQEMGTDISFALDKLLLERVLKAETAEKMQAVEDLRQKEQLLIQQTRLAAMGEMIGNIAHQWRQPLNTVGLMVQAIELEYESGQLDHDRMGVFVKNIMGQVRHMSDTIDDFSNFFRPDKKKVRFIVQDEVRRTLSLLEATFQAERVQVSTETGEDQEVEGYRNEFCQVLLNIMSNAKDVLKERKTPEARIQIRIGREGDRTVVQIADNAGGIPEQIIGKVFDPYFTTKGPDAGTGVGLFMSKMIIEKNMGGSLTVRNGVEGAEFRIVV